MQHVSNRGADKQTERGRNRVVHAEEVAAEGTDGNMIAGLHLPKAHILQAVLRELPFDEADCQFAAEDRDARRAKVLEQIRQRPGVIL
jgi:hypothetical protein